MPPQQHLDPGSAPISHAQDTRRVAVVIPTWNGDERVRRCLASLIDPVIAEICIVDNGSTRERAAELRKIEAELPGRVRVCRSEQNRGFAAACNLGISETKSPWIAVLNDDTRCASRALTRLVRAAQASPMSGLVAPRSNYVKGRQLLDASVFQGADLDAEDVEGVQSLATHRATGLVEDVEQLSGLCLLGTRESWTELGGFDERFGAGNFEDDDLCLRARRGGMRLLVVHDSYVWHEGNATFRSLGIDYDAQMREQERIFVQKWSGSALALAERAESREDREAIGRLRDDLRQLSGKERMWAAAVLAREAQRSGEIEEACREWQRLLCVAPLHREARCCLMLALLANEREDESRAMLDAIRSDFGLDPIALASAYTQRSKAYLDRGEHEVAAGEIQEALALVPDYVPAHNARAILALAQSDYVRARTILEAIDDSSSADVLNNLGIARFECGDREGARDALRRGAALGGPGSPAATNLSALEAHVHAAG